MKIRLKNPLNATEWTAFAVWALLVGGIYAVLVQPSLRLATGVEEFRDQKVAVIDELNRARLSLGQVQQRIEAGREELERLGGAPPPASRKDLIIAQLAGMADASGLTIEQYTPIDTIEETDHRAFYVQFSAHGSYPAIHDYFRRVETAVDFVDITHFNITAIPREDDQGCMIQWSCRVNVLRGDAPPPAPMARTARSPRMMAEVTRHDD